MAYIVVHVLSVRSKRIVIDTSVKDQLEKIINNANLGSQIVKYMQCCEYGLDV